MFASRPTSVEAVTRVVAEWGGLDILVNNAGVGGFVEVSKMTAADWHRVIDTNLTGVYHCCHAAIPHLKARGGGWIINVSSLAGKNPFVGGAAYCASKAGLNAFSEALMQEVRHDGIRVSVVMPGSVQHGLQRRRRRPGHRLEAGARRRRAGHRRSGRASRAQPAQPRRDPSLAPAAEMTLVTDPHAPGAAQAPAACRTGRLSTARTHWRRGARRGVPRARHRARPHGRPQAGSGGADRRRRANRAAPRHGR